MKQFEAQAVSKRDEEATHTHDEDEDEDEEAEDDHEEEDRRVDEKDAAADDSDGISFGHDDEFHDGGEDGVAADAAAFAVEQACRLGGCPLNLSRCQLVGQGRAGKTALARAFCGLEYVQTASTIGVNCSMLEVEKTTVNAHAGGNWTAVTDGSRIMTAEDAVACSAADLLQANQLQAHQLQANQLQTNQQPPDAKLPSDAAAAAAPIEGTSMVQLLAAAVDVEPGAPTEAAKTGHLRAAADDVKSGTSAAKKPTTATTARVSVDQEAVKGAVIQKMGMTLNGGPSGPHRDGFSPLRLFLWDCAGQENFYVLLHLYMSRYCVYPIIFNMEWLLPGAPERETCLSFLNFWLGAVVMHAVDPTDGSIAPILIIGTHKDKVPDPEQHEAISKLLDDLFQAHPAWSRVLRNRAAQVKSGLGVLWFFPVDSTRGAEDPGIQEVKKTVLGCVSDEKYVKAKVPYSWLLVYGELEKETRTCVQLKEVEAICADCGMQGTADRGVVGEALAMLKYFTELGLIMHHPDAALRQLVILNPAEAVIAPASIVLCSHDIHENEVLLEARTKMPQLYALLRQGILDQEILTILWKDYADMQTELQFLMTKYQLIVPIFGDEEDSRVRFLVPALLPAASPAQISAGARLARLVGYVIFGRADDLKAVRATSKGYVAVEEVRRKLFLPKGLFTAVVGKVVEECQRVHNMSMSDMDLSVSSISTAFGRHAFTLSELPHLNMMELVISVETPLLIVERLQALIQSAVSKMLQSLHFAICVHEGGGVCQDGRVAAPEGHLVVLNGPGGLEERLAAAPPQDIAVAPRMRISPVEARTRFAPWLVPTGLLKFYHVFVSYRWGVFDTELAKAIFSILCVTIICGGLQVRVFLDRNRLEDGRDFPTDFSTALINSLVAVPIVSYASLERMLKLTAGSNVDNVLLEWTLIVELMAIGHLKYCLPVMLGEVTPDATDGNFVSDLFTLGAMDKLPKVVCVKVADRVKELLLANGKTPSPLLHTYTVHDVVTRITRLLGVTGWDVNDTSGESSSHGGAFMMHAQAKWKQKLFKLAVSKTIDCVEKAAQSATVSEAPAAAATAVAAPVLDDAIEEQPQRVSLPAQAAIVRGDSSLRREISQLKRNEQESQIQAELARKDAEIERARMDAERKEAEAEKKQLLLQLEIERLKNQSTPPAASACCSVS